MKWECTEQTWRSVCGRYVVRNFDYCGRDCFYVWRVIAGVHTPVMTKGGRTLYRKSLKAAQAWCEKDK